MIKTKSVYEPKADDDGIRVLVTRYWPRGVKKDFVDHWLKDLGTAAALIKLWRAGSLDWERFRESYIAEFSSEGKSASFKELKEIIKGAGRVPVTLLCVCREDARCHRSVLKDMLGA
jgi:uncharacterized protein YeaO (DUF488 family)